MSRPQELLEHVTQAREPAIEFRYLPAAHVKHAALLQRYWLLSPGQKEPLGQGEQTRFSVALQVVDW